MKKKLPSSVRSGLSRLGKSLKEARIRRRLKMVTVCDRAGISRETLAKIQRGDPSVSMGAYAAVIFVLGFKTKWMEFAEIWNDPVGQGLDEERMPKRVRDVKL